jgi:ArsR family transcriptional regulator
MPFYIHIRKSICFGDFVFQHFKIVQRSSFGAVMIVVTPLQLFKNLSDETRLNIVLSLKEVDELCVNELCAVLSQVQPTISWHLAILRETGLLLDRRAGKRVHYRLSPHIPAWAAAIIEQAYRSQRDEIALLQQGDIHGRSTTAGNALSI